MHEPGRILSHPVTSDQSGPHLELEAKVSRHLHHTYLRPYAAHTVTAWARTKAWLAQRISSNSSSPPTLILDSGCGVAESSIRLALAHPQASVLAVDQSADRLSRVGAHARMLGLTGVPSNLLLCRADLEDFWRLMLADGVRPDQHWILYPNPWPKPPHLGRRWQGHPVFPILLALGGQLELRTNWRIYAEEFALALGYAGAGTPQVEPLPLSPHEPDQAMTPFERKYALSGQPLWRVRLQVDDQGFSARWVARPTAKETP